MVSNQSKQNKSKNSTSKLTKTRSKQSAEKDGCEDQPLPKQKKQEVPGTPKQSKIDSPKLIRKAPVRGKRTSKKV